MVRRDHLVLFRWETVLVMAFLIRDLDQEHVLDIPGDRRLGHVEAGLLQRFRQIALGLDVLRSDDLLDCFLPG